MASITFDQFITNWSHKEGFENQGDFKKFITPTILGEP